MTDTISAISSPFGEGAIGVLRLSGPQSHSILTRLFSGKLAKARELSHGRLEKDGTMLDDVLATKFDAPRSYTGEDMAEIFCHGGLLVTRRILDALLEEGARLAEPGEFSFRAFSNGKMDLTQAEAVMDVIHAQTDLALRASQQQLAGRLGHAMDALRTSLLQILAHLEAYIDFPDEDIDPDTGQSFLTRIETVSTEIAKLLATADRGRILREGVRTVIYGEPNVGKSSLLNALSGFDRAIVSPTPGTTRDVIEESVNIGGIRLILMDTAGIRDTSDEIEKQGVARSQKAHDEADLIIEVHAANLPLPSNSNVSKNTLLVANKADLGVHPSWTDHAVLVSCLQETGFDDLEAAILQKVFGGGAQLDNASAAINARHKNCLQRAQSGCIAAMTGLRENLAIELISIELHSALDAIGEVMGKVESDDILGEIFSTFCIGK
ncbi:MAG: tRNA uridine-5-carboxymethylaminomethyl(34) synthesis GTPase MnmE [Chthoniobacterales bacterium]